MTPETILLQVRDLGVKFRVEKRTETTAVKQVSFDVPANQTVALVGESGSGKSVTSLAILGLLPEENARIDSGSQILYRGRDLLRESQESLRALRGKEISMIFQEPMTSLNPVFSVGDQIIEPLRLHMGLTRKQARARAEALLNEVGISEPARRLNAYPHELSGGQQQRIMIAIAIACEPKLLIADEPTTSLDVTIQKQILDLLADLQRKHRMAILLVTHDLAVVSSIADHVVVMQAGEVREAGPAREIFASPRHPYTKALLMCRPRLDVKPVRLPVIEDFLDGGPPRTDSAAIDRRVDSADGAIVLQVHNLSKDFIVRQGLFRTRRFHAVRNASCALRRGETLGLVGESGSGKTTLALSLLRLYQASAGEVLFDGKNLLALSAQEFMPYKRRIQIVFQNPYASLNPRFTVAHLLTEPMQIHGIGSGDAERLSLAAELLRKVGLPESSLSKYAHQFSGGQRQRIAIARCLTLKPEVLICDESVSALDVSIQAQVLNLLKDLQDEFGMSYIFISHDLAVVKYISDHVLVMHDGEVVESASSEEIYRAPQHPYTRQLLAAIPESWPSATAA
jgi:peptide/nickel transport system ATP-binding protein